MNRILLSIIATAALLFTGCTTYDRTDASAGGTSSYEPYAKYGRTTGPTYPYSSDNW